MDADGISRAEDAVPVKVMHVDDPFRARTTWSFSSSVWEVSLSGSFDSSILREVKPPTGEPYAGDPPVRFGGRGSCTLSLPLSCDAAGAGDGATESPNRARRGKPRTQPRMLLRATAPVLDPTGIDNSIGEYFMISHRDLPSLIQAAEGRIADWEEFNHLVLEDESWSRSWRKIELSDRCTVIDPSGIYFKGIDSNGVNSLTAALVGADLASIELPEHAHALSAAAE